MDVSGTILPGVDEDETMAPFDAGIPPGVRLIDLSANRIELVPSSTALVPGRSTGPPPLEAYVFHPGVVTPVIRRKGRLTAVSTSAPNRPPLWADRIKIAPAKGKIRLFEPPSDVLMNGHFSLGSLWFDDITLTEWIRKIDAVPESRTIFERTQRQRWLARLVLQRWTQRVWLKRVQCNVDMIDMLPVADSKAVFLTDTHHHQIFRFHRNDVFTNLLTNICMSDEMLPSPRPPTNPWTNEPLTMPQTMAICQQLVADYAKRGICPPVLFSAFWAARFSLRRFADENSAMLSQHAIRAYFKDLHEHNEDVVLDTMTNLLTSAHQDFSMATIRRWLRQSPQTPIHREWLALARDYTLYMNLHIQARPHWHTEEYIYRDAQRLFRRTDFPMSERMRILQNPALNPNNMIPQPSIYTLMGLPIILQPPQLLRDISGNAMGNDLALQLIQQALFRF